jgi:hypothetical protein
MIICCSLLEVYIDDLIRKQALIGGRGVSVQADEKLYPVLSLSASLRQGRAMMCNPLAVPSRGW